MLICGWAQMSSVAGLWSFGTRVYYYIPIAPLTLIKTCSRTELVLILWLVWLIWISYDGCGPVVMWPCGHGVLWLCGLARPRASLGNALACVRHLLSRFRMTTHLVRCLVQIPDVKDFFAHRPCPWVGFDLKLCVFVGHRWDFLP